MTAPTPETPVTYAERISRARTLIHAARDGHRPPEALRDERVRLDS